MTKAKNEVFIGSKHEICYLEGEQTFSGGSLLGGGFFLVGG